MGTITNIVVFNAICWLAIGAAALFGLSEGAGLFAAIVGGGSYILFVLGRNDTSS